MRLITYILLFVTLSSCNPAKLFFGDEVTEAKRKERRFKRAEKKLDNLVKKFPELITEKKIEVPVEVDVDSTEIYKRFSDKKDLTRLEEVIDSLLDLEHVPEEIIKEVIRRTVINTPCFEDTMRVDTSIRINVNNNPIVINISFGVYPIKPSDYELFFKIPPDQKTEFSFETEEPVIQPPALTAMEEIILLINKWMKWIILVLILLIIIRFFGKAIRTAIKKIFHI